MARPTILTDEMADYICEQISTTNRSLKQICTDECCAGYSTVMRWIKDDVNGFRDKYAHAKQVQAEALFDEIIQIADDSSNDIFTDSDGKEIVNHEHINRARLRVDARKWVVSKLIPKKYGEKIDLTTNGENINKSVDLSNLKIEDLERLAKELDSGSGKD